jgi:protein-S-isoprenylcysteine O-methyltransferase Ste14
MVYFLITVVLALSTRYYSDHPIILFITGSAVLVTGIIRIAISRRLLAEALGITKNVRRFFFASDW